MSLENLPSITRYDGEITSKSHFGRQTVLRINFETPKDYLPKIRGEDGNFPRCGEDIIIYFCNNKASEIIEEALNDANISEYKGLNLGQKIVRAIRHPKKGLDNLTIALCRNFKHFLRNSDGVCTKPSKNCKYCVEKETSKYICKK